ncbi:MAG: methyl-accepting chemotaxis protein [Granulosicoccus sp.]
MSAALVKMHPHSSVKTELCETVESNAFSLYTLERQRYHAKIDKLFLVLFALQWPIAVLMALYLTPNTWQGTDSYTHLHVYMAIGLGAIASLFPAWLVWSRPGSAVTRHTIAVASMVFTALFIHLSGGREEGHFHFFVMMAFISLYFDWRVVLTAIVVGALDHIFRAAMFPMSVFGVLESPWVQLIRHVLWVVFEGSVLIYAALIIDKDKRRASEELAISQKREADNAHLLQQHKKLSLEREQEEKEYRRLTTEKREAELLQSTQAKQLAKSKLEEAERVRVQVDSLLESVNEAANGNLAVRIRTSGDDDSIARVGIALSQLLESLRYNFQEISANTHTLTESASQLMLTSGELGKDSSENSSEIEHVASSAKKINKDVQIAATATEQTNVAIREVSRCASEAVAVGQDAVALANSANTTVKQLSDSSKGIGDVLKVINSIAEQTNLLALNATIEAARAGDSGKGFAVVASEIKELARETARATDEISDRIQTIQSDAVNVEQVIGQISNIILQIENYQATVSAAVEEQTATTREIHGNVSSSATDSASISEHMEAIAERAERAKFSAELVESSAESLNDIAMRLQDLIGSYSIEYPQLSAKRAA